MASLERSGSVEAVNVAVQSGQMFSPRWSPVVEAGLESNSVGQSVGDRETSTALQLGQDDDDLPV